MYFIFDIGRTNTRIAWSDIGDGFTDPKVIKTPSENNYDTLLEILEQEIDTKKDELTSIIGCITGWFQWSKHLQSDLQAYTSVPVYIGNDADFAGLGEAVYGAGTDSSIIAYLTISSGVGGTRIVNKSIDVSAHGFGPGKHYIDLDRSACPRASLGTVEEYISGVAVEERYGIPPYEITDSEVWEEFARYTGYFLVNVATMWSPEIIIVGGSMVTGNPAIDLTRAEVAMKKNWASNREPSPVRLAELGDFGGLYGALAYSNKHNL